MQREFCFILFLNEFSFEWYIILFILAQKMLRKCEKNETFFFPFSPLALTAHGEKKVLYKPL